MLSKKILQFINNEAEAHGDLNEVALFSYKVASERWVKELIEFSEWAGENSWVFEYDLFAGKRWYNDLEDPSEYITTSQLLEKYLVSKEQNAQESDTTEAK